jgi:hypothetical protein
VKLSSTLLIVSLALFGSNLASAEEMEAGKQCDALSDAFTNYSSRKSDPDADKATALALEGGSDCKDGRFDDGINKINNAMGMVHDGVDSGRSGRR